MSYYFMHRINANIINDLNETEIEFGKEVKYFFFDGNDIWLEFSYPKCCIYAQLSGNGIIYLYRTPVNYNFIFERAKDRYINSNHRVVCVKYDINANDLDFKTTVEKLSEMK